MEIELDIQDKQQYLNDHYPFEGVPNLTDRRVCIHCDNWFTVEDYKVFKEMYDADQFEYICCPNYLSCGGMVIDWFREYYIPDPQKEGITT